MLVKNANKRFAGTPVKKGAIGYDKIGHHVPKREKYHSYGFRTIGI